MKAEFIPAIASQSLGRAWHHSLEHKLSLCHQYGLGTVELFFEDLEAVANNLPSSHPPMPSGSSFTCSTEQQEKQIAAARYIQELCVHSQLEILCLQPFMHYDGLIDTASHEAAIEKLHFWIRLAHILETDLIQIPSSFLHESQCSGSREKIVADLREAADVGLRSSPPVRFSYEALCWGTHVDTWDVAWSIILEVDRPNFGTCLDTFNIAGRVFGDPASPTGMTPNSYEDTRETIAKLRSELPRAIEKIFYVEICDGERLDQPLVPGHKWYHPEQKARMSWSRNARLFPFEEPGYLPVLEVLEAICDAGYRGPISFELFSESANQPGKNVPEEHARRAATAWAKLEEHMHWNDSADVSCNASLSPSSPATSLSSSPKETKKR